MKKLSLMLMVLFSLSHAQDDEYPVINGCKLEPNANCAKINLSNQNLQNLDLQNANFEGANFEGAILDGVNFTKAKLKKEK